MEGRRFSRPLFLRILTAIFVLAATLLPVSCTSAQTSTAKQANATAETTETIVMFRHGEKAPGGLGQLTCQGLNRALALPNVLLPRYGTPDFLFAPNPAEQVSEGGLYSYVRPLGTLEPTAIRVGRPVNTQLGFRQIVELQKLLTQPEYAKSLIFVAWEHGYLRDFARQFLQSYGENPGVVADWPQDDFDTIYVFHLTRGEGNPRLTFHAEQERLNGLPTTCPGQQ